MTSGKVSYTLPLPGPFWLVSGVVAFNSHTISGGSIDFVNGRRCIFQSMWPCDILIFVHVHGNEMVDVVVLLISLLDQQIAVHSLIEPRPSL